MMNKEWYGDGVSEETATERQAKFLWTFNLRNPKLLANVLSKEERCALHLSDAKVFFGGLSKKRAGDTITELRSMENKIKTLGRQKTANFIKFEDGYCENCDIPMMVIDTGFKCNLCGAVVIKISHRSDHAD
jgi:hypothetical protein